jgi:hypothetical protein
MSEKSVRVNLIPPDDVTGCYSNIVAVWHTPYDFTLDFGVLGQPVERDDELVVDTPVVARVKLPVSVIFSLAKAIAENVDNYEKAFGAITPSAPDGPLFPPQEPSK